MRNLSSLASLRERLALFIGVWALFALVYYGTTLLPHAAAHVLSADPVWRVPYIRAFIVPYTSVYVMPLVLLLIPCDLATFRRICGAISGAALASAPWFVLLPLVPPRVALNDENLWDRFLAFQFRLDVYGNCFPSLHVSLAFLIAFATGHCLRSARLPMLAWATLVAASTVFVRQHYVIDVIGGFCLALVIWRITFRSAARS